LIALNGRIEKQNEFLTYLSSLSCYPILEYGITQVFLRWASEAQFRLLKIYHPSAIGMIVSIFEDKLLHLVLDFL